MFGRSLDFHWNIRRTIKYRTMIMLFCLGRISFQRSMLSGSERIPLVRKEVLWKGPLTGTYPGPWVLLSFRPRSERSEMQGMMDLPLRPSPRSRPRTAERRTPKKPPSWKQGGTIDGAILRSVLPPGERPDRTHTRKGMGQGEEPQGKRPLASTPNPGSGPGKIGPADPPSANGERVFGLARYHGDL